MSAPTNYADLLAEVAALVALHPDLPSPCIFAYGSTRSVDVTWQLMNDDATKSDQRDAMTRIARAVGGTWTKRARDDRFDLVQRRGQLTLEIIAHREQVCTRRVVGTEEFTIPAQPAVEAQPERTEVREVVEWDCSPLLAGGVG